jgi:hypothetical protein
VSVLERFKLRLRENACVSDEEIEFVALSRFPKLRL